LKPASPASPSVEPRGNPRAVCTVWFALFFISFLLYAATANRGAQWQDSGYHILRVVSQEPVNPLGLALSHPLHHWLGRTAVSLNLFEPCFAITLLSGLAAAIAGANIFGCVQALTRSWTAALFAALSLAVAHTFWQMATLTETYTLAAALLSGECWCLILYAQTKRPAYLWGMLLLNGLGISNHLLAVLITPVLAVVAVIALRRRDIRVQAIAVGAVLWLLGASPYGVMVASEWMRSGNAWATIESALFGHGYRDDVLNTTISAGIMIKVLGFVIINFPNLLLPLAAYGMLSASKVNVPTTARRALLTGLVLHTLFVVRYSTVDQHTFFLSAYVLLAIFGGIGFSAWTTSTSTNKRRARSVIAFAAIAWTPLLYSFLPNLARHWRVLGSAERHKPYRDDYEYLFTPWSIAEKSAERMSREAVALAGANGVIIVEDRMAEFAVRYQARDIPSDRLRIIGDVDWRKGGSAVPSKQPVVYVPLNVNKAPEAPESYSWRRIGDLYLLHPVPPGS